MATLTAQYLLRAHPGARDALALAAERELDRLFTAGAAASVRVCALVDGLVEQTEWGRTWGVGGFDVIVDVASGDLDDWERVIAYGERFPEIFRDLVNAAESYAQIGREYVFTSGEMPLLLLVANDRPLSLPYEEMHARWLGRHGWLVKTGVRSGAGYRQVHADPKASILGARRAGMGRTEYDGTGAAYWSGAEEYLALMSNIDNLEQLIADEDAILDRAGSSAGMYSLSFTRGER